MSAGAHYRALIIRVSARAVDGKATEAALAAVAGLFGVRRSAVRLVSGTSSRAKIVGADVGTDAFARPATSGVTVRGTRAASLGGMPSTRFPAATS